MRLIDLHCDTLSEMKKGGYSFRDSPLHISEGKASAFSPYIQCAAVWSDRSLSDEEAWDNFFVVTDHFRDVTGYRFIKNGEQLDCAVREKKTGFILTCEGARLLNGKTERLDILYERGVRILTLTWAGHDIIGGSHGTDFPLTDFGRDVVRRCFEIGIIPDVSHGSRRVAKEVCDMAKEYKKAPVATHSNSFSVYSHQRNLTDEEFSYIISLGGIVGISLAPEHLAKKDAGIGDVVRHIKHYVNLGGISSVALGCDFDGISSTPAGIADISELDRLFYALCDAGFSEDSAERIFFTNAYDFLKKNIK